jgi:hypothetical protein
MITRIITTTPITPPGAYPQDRLCGQTGIIPISASIRMMSNIVPIVMIRSPFKMMFNPNHIGLGRFISQPGTAGSEPAVLVGCELA